MSVQPGHLTPVAPPARATGGATAVPAATVRPAAELREVTADVVGSAPPPEVSEQVTLAARIAADIRANNRELHFSHDPNTGRIVVQVRDLDGNVLKTIPPSKALAIMSGEEAIGA
jgi:flagellar protein FlaG